MDETSCCFDICCSHQQHHFTPQRIQLENLNALRFSQSQTEKQKHSKIKPNLALSSSSAGLKTDRKIKDKKNLVSSFSSAGLQEQKARRTTNRRFFILLPMPGIQATISVELFVLGIR